MDAEKFAAFWLFRNDSSSFIWSCDTQISIRGGKKTIAGTDTIKSLTAKWRESGKIAKAARRPLATSYSAKKFPKKIATATQVNKEVMTKREFQLQKLLQLRRFQDNKG